MSETPKGPGIRIQGVGMLFGDAAITYLADMLTTHRIIHVQWSVSGELKSDTSGWWLVMALGGFKTGGRPTYESAFSIFTVAMPSHGALAVPLDDWMSGDLIRDRSDLNTALIEFVNKLRGELLRRSKANALDLATTHAAKLGMLLAASDMKGAVAEPLEINRIKTGSTVFTAPVNKTPVVVPKLTVPKLSD